VGVGVVQKVQGRDDSVSRLDGDLFHAKQYQHRPDEIDELCGNDERSQGCPGSGSLGGEGDCVMSDVQ